MSIPSKHLKVGHHRPTCETPFKWRFTGGPIVARDYAGCVVLYKPSLTLLLHDCNKVRLWQNCEYAFDGHQGPMCVCKQARFEPECTYAQSPLSLHWSIMLHIVCMWPGKVQTRLHLCAISSEPSLTTFTPFCLHVSREDSEETALVYNLP